MPKKTRTTNLKPLSRSITLSREDMNEEKRTVSFSFSSEEPVERYFGKEVLSHEPSSVRLGRLRNGGPLLVDHNTCDHVGKIENASIDSDRKGRVTVRFGKSERAEEIFQDVLDGIRHQVSVMYRIHKMEEDRDTDTFTATDWEPYEVSFVSVPADPTVGIGREQPNIKNETIIYYEERTMPDKIPPTAVPAAPAPAAITMSKADREAILAEDRIKESSRVDEIRALGSEHNMIDVAENAVRDGTTVEKMRVNVLDTLRDSTPAPASSSSDLDLSSDDNKRFSVLRAIEAQITGNWKHAGFERECSDEIAERNGTEARGFYLPLDVQTRTMSAGTDTAGGYLIPEDRQPMIEYLRANTVIGAAGATFLSGLVGDLSIPKQTGSSTAYWLTEDEDGTDSEPTLGNVLLQPKTVSDAVPMTRKLLKQSNPSVEALVMNDMNRVVALAIDLAALNGTGVDGQPLGVMLETGLSTIAIATPGSPTWAEMVAFETNVDSSNALDGALSYITTTGVKGSLKTTPKDAGSGIFIMGEGNTVNGYNVLSTTQMPANGILFGNFSSIIVGSWGVLDVIVDTSTKVKAGGLVLRVFQDVDMGVRHIESFAKNA